MIIPSCNDYWIFEKNPYFWKTKEKYWKMEIIAPAKRLGLRFLLWYQKSKKPGKSGEVSKEIKEVNINSSSILFINIGVTDFPCKPILECLLPFNTFKGISTLIKRKFILLTITLLPTLKIKVIKKLHWNNRLYKLYFFSWY